MLLACLLVPADVAISKRSVWLLNSLHVISLLCSGPGLDVGDLIGDFQGGVAFSGGLLQIVFSFLSCENFCSV